MEHDDMQDVNQFFDECVNKDAVLRKGWLCDYLQKYKKTESKIKVQTIKETEEEKRGREVILEGKW